MSHVEQENRRNAVLSDQRITLHQVLTTLTQTSLLPKIAASAGYDFGDLCEAILAGARTHQPARRKPVARVTELRPGRAAALRAATG